MEACLLADSELSTLLGNASDDVRVKGFANQKSKL